MIGSILSSFEWILLTYTNPSESASI